MTVHFLSHKFENPLPIYGSAQGKFDVIPLKAISRGDSSQTFRIGFENHWGTHIDAPAHFFQNAPGIADYLADYWLFKSPQVLEIAMQEDQLISVELLVNKIDSQTDLLLIKTGFQIFRGQEKYSCHNPGIKAEVGRWLRESHPFIKAVGFDFISLSSYQNRAEGRLAHKQFLDPQGIGNPILIIEDMNLEPPLPGLTEVVALPLLVNGIDSAPCTVIGMCRE